ncbi:MAG: ABC transporter substrate-binding protein [Thermus sp.]|uniref:ABC transporter substrate-binding protein n=1 Tax=Thermus sp. TaxID=275 RepID=UPI00298EFBE6|nr:ABC transporter substrate-binding protein [Thermus sp.]MDW8018215.1 ABC transporter substrate-binding protein [Thermus sp.]
MKIGFVSTLSGPGAALGIDIRDGFNLALSLNGGRLGGLPAEVIVVDDQQNPDVARQVVDRFLRRDRVDFITGIVYSNILLAVGGSIFESRTFYISPNAGPSQYAGSECNPFFFNVAWQNDNLHEVMGHYAAQQNFDTAVLVAPNYQAGYDALAGFKRFYRGKVLEEIYTRLNQLDYAAEIARIRSLRPRAVYAFLPGGLGISFVKQYAEAGLKGTIPLLLPGFSADQDVIQGTGEALLGIANSSHWALELDNPTNRRFVAEFQRAYKRIPTLYAAQGFDAALLLDAAIRAAEGRIADKEAMLKALRTAKWESTRGPFRFNRNHFPVQDYYLRRVVRKEDGGLINRLVGRVFRQHQDAYVQNCRMSW